MADELKGCIMMSTPKAIARRSLPDDPQSWSPDMFENRSPWSSPVINQKSSLYCTTDIRRTLLEGRMAFGSPSYPSPLDRVRTKRIDRGLQMGLPPYQEESFELNQSYPKITKPSIRQELSAPKITMGNVHGDGLNDFSFSPGLCKGSFATAAETLSGQSLSDSWSFYNYIGGGQTGMVFPTTVRNPNKAICTINAKTSEILIVNDMACELFGYDQADLVGKNLHDLIHLKPRDQKTLKESHLEPTGEVVSLSGIVVDAIDSNDLVIPVSLWVKKLQYRAEPRCLCVMEPVDRSVGTVVFDKKGSVLVCDQGMANLHGYPSPDEIEGLTMRHLIPTFKHPSSVPISKEVKKQQATGKTKTGATFPLSITVSLAAESIDMRNIPPDTESIIKSRDPDDVYIGVIWVFANISGMITFLPNGTIHNVNENFSTMLFGFTKEELIGKDISTLIPNFYDILDLEDDIPLPPLADDIVIAKNLHGDVSLSDHSDILKELQELCIKPGITSTPRSAELTCNKFGDKKCSVSRQLVEKENTDPKTICAIKCLTNNILCENTKNDFSPERLNARTGSKGDFIEDSSQDSALNQSNESISTDELLTSPPIRLEDSFSEQSCIEKSNSNVSSSQDGVNADISSDGSTDEQTAGRSLTSENRKEKILDDILKRVVKRNYLNLQETSSDSTDGSFGCRVKQTDILPVLSNNNQSVFTNSASDRLVDDESSYFSRDELDSQPSINSSASIDYLSRDRNHSNKCENSSNQVGNHINKCQNSSNQVGNHTNKYQNSSNQVGNHTNKCQNSSQRHKEGGNHSCHSSDSAFTNNVLSSEGSLCDNAGGSIPSLGCLERLSSRQSGTQTSHIESHDFPGGSFSGLCNHKDGQRLPVVFQVKPVELDDGSVVYCMWLSRDPEEPGEGGRSFANLTLASSLNSTFDKSNMSLGELLAEKANSDSKIADPVVVEEVKPVIVNNDPSQGQYNVNYTTLDSIGKGAFGFVKLGKRKSDQEEVVVKFIRRAKVLLDNWVDSVKYGRIPLEVGLLLSLNHPNIVKVLDVYENKDFVQMVMEKHGMGMDLFEFIDRGPQLDEALCSYIFRQMVSAVVYLHSRNILHRDIKDENIIVSEDFSIKLIDFGAAAYLKPGRMFSTFCGTLEYCSPEVLLGNKYRGPELEVWSMGVTLYTLVFGENPFFDVEESTHGTLNPPFKVSRSLMFLISWLLHPDPQCRATVKDADHNAWVNQPINILLYAWSQVLPNCEFHGNTGSDHRKDTPEGEFDIMSQKLNKSLFDSGELSEKLKKCLVLDESTDYY